MNPTEVVALIGLAGTVLTAVVSPWLLAKMRNAAANSPAAGWRAAVAAYDEQAEMLQAQLQYAQAELGHVRSALDEAQRQLRTKAVSLADCERIRDATARQLDGAQHRVTQLEATIQAGGLTVPAPPPS